MIQTGTTGATGTAGTTSTAGTALGVTMKEKEQPKITGMAYPYDPNRIDKIKKA